MKKMILAAVAALAAAPAFPQPAPVWTHEGGFARIAASASGLYASLPGIPYVPPENYGYGQVYPVATVRLDAASGSQLWFQQHPGFDPGHDIHNSPRDIAVGPGGAVFNGFYEMCVNGFHSNGVVVAYDAAGTQTWAARYYPGSYTTPFAVAADAAGNAYLAANTGIGGWGSPVVYHATVTKYDATGAVVGAGELPAEWTPYWIASDVAVNANQDVFVTGSPGTLKLDGTTLAVLWSVPVAGAQVVAADDGGAYVTGASGTVRLAATGETLWSAAAGVQLVAANGGAIVTDGTQTVQYTANGATAWTLAAGGGDLAYDGGEYVYLLSGGTISKYGVDRDLDGSPAPRDCNPGDASIYPGATEAKRDGIDQDCNGYDLTIQVTKAQYMPKSSLLRVEATSALGASAGLVLTGFGPMTWVALDAKWVINAKPAAGNPGSVTVQGIEGADLPVAVTVK